MKLHDFFAQLNSTLVTGTGRTWGQGEPPSDFPVVPYGIVFPVSGGNSMPGIDNPMSWLTVRVHILGVGSTMTQALWLQDRIMTTLLGTNRTPVSHNGQVVNMVQLETLGGVRDDGHSLFSTSDVYRFGVPGNA